MAAGLGRGIIETELRRTSLNESDQKIISDLLVKNNESIEKYFKENATKQTSGDIIKGLRKKGMNI